MTRVTTLCKKDVAILKKWEKKLVYKLKLIVVGKIKEEYYRKKVAEFSKIIEKKINFQIIELEDESIPKKASDSIMSQVKEKEGNRQSGLCSCPLHRWKNYNKRRNEKYFSKCNK